MGIERYRTKKIKLKSDKQILMEERTNKILKLEKKPLKDFGPNYRYEDDTPFIEPWYT